MQRGQWQLIDEDFLSTKISFKIMGIKTRGRRKLLIANRSFVYYGDEWNLRIASVDKKFIVRLRTLFTPWDAYQPEGFTPLEIIGSEFPKLIKFRERRVNYSDRNLNTWVKYSKQIGQGKEFTPRIVRQIIDWCFETGTEAEQVILSDFDISKNH